MQKCSRPGLHGYLPFTTRSSGRFWTSIRNFVLLSFQTLGCRSFLVPQLSVLLGSYIWGLDVSMDFVRLSSYIIRSLTLACAGILAAIPYGLIALSWPLVFRVCRPAYGSAVEPTDFVTTPGSESSAVL